MEKIRKFLQKSAKSGIFMGAVLFLIHSSAYASQNKTAEIVFNSQPIVTNISQWSTAEDGTIAEFVEKDGKIGLVRGPGKRNFITLNIADDYWYEEVGVSVKVSVEYFDEGTGKFTLRYNSAKNGRWASCKDIVNLTNTKEWKIHTFDIDDIILNNNLQNNGDMEVSTWTSSMGGSETDVVFRSAKIDEVFPENPVTSTIHTGKTGNIFGREDEVSFPLKSKNITDYMLDSLIECTVYDSAGNVVKTITNEVKLLPDEECTTQISIPDAKYDIYTISVKVKSEGKIDGENKSFETTEAMEFSKVCTTLSGEAKNDYFNLCTHLAGKDLEKSAEIIEGMGIGTVRDGYYWSDAEAVKGELKLKDDYQSRINTLSDKGIGVLQILAYNNPLYNGGKAITEAPETSDEINGFANYAGFMAKSLKGHVDKFEIWNEWNNKSFNASGTGVEAYVELLKASYRAIKAEDANPNATVYGVAVANADNSFLQMVLRSGGYDYMDAISVHPYDWSGDFSYSNLIDDVNKMKATISAYGNKPIVFTEMGWNTGDNKSGVTQAEQARYAVQLTAISKAYDLAEEIYWYDFQNDGRENNEVEDNFGTVDYHYSANPYGAKLSYLSISAMNRFMAGGIEYSSKIEDDMKETMMYSFDRTTQNDKLGILWSDVEGGKTVGLKLGCENIKVYDLFGNLMKEERDIDGYYEFYLSEDPIYVTGEFTAFEESIRPSAIESLEASYDKNKNIISVMGAAKWYDSFTLELIRNGEVFKSVAVNVKPDGSFYKIMTAPEDGSYEIYAAKREADINGTDGYLNTTLNVLKNPGYIREPVSLESGVTVDIKTREITVCANLSDYEEGALASVIVVKEGCTDINKETILYIADLTVEDGTFSHRFKMPYGSVGKYDVYIGGSFLNNPQIIDVGYGIAKVQTLSLEASDNTYKVTANIKNNNTEDKMAVLFVAQYDKTGRLLALDKKDITVPANAQEPEGYELSVNKEIETANCKAYIWDCANNMYPLY